MCFQQACNWYQTKGRDKMLESRAATQRVLTRLPWNSLRTRSRFLFWDDASLRNNPNWRITVQREAGNASDHQAEYDLGKCSCSTEGQCHSGMYYQEHSQQVLGSGSSRYMALVRPYRECCCSGHPSTGEEGHQRPRVRPEEASKMAGSWMQLWGEAVRSGPAQS